LVHPCVLQQQLDHEGLLKAPYIPLLEVFQTGTLEFDINGTAELDAPKMLSFAEEVNSLLAKSTLLISSDGG
jgi:hypothetical protein